MRFGHALVIERALFTGSASDGRVHPFLPFSIRHDARGCPILCCEARSFFLSFTAKGGITITVHAQEIAPGFPELVMWRKDHRIPPFAKTKNAKDGAPSCVVAQAKVGHPPSSEVDGPNQKTPDEASSNPPSAKVINKMTDSRPVRGKRNRLYTGLCPSRTVSKTCEFAIDSLSRLRYAQAAHTGGSAAIFETCEGSSRGRLSRGRAHNCVALSSQRQ